MEGKVKIIPREKGGWHMFINGVDIADYVNDITVRIEGPYAANVELTIVLIRGQFEFEGNAEIETTIKQLGE